MKTVEVLVYMVGELKKAGLIGAGLCWTFFEKRVQPLKVRPHFMWLYSDQIDAMRESPDELSTSEIAAHLVTMLEMKTVEARTVFMGHPPPRTLKTNNPNVSLGPVLCSRRSLGLISFFD
jgi:hypothetical protein